MPPVDGGSRIALAIAAVLPEGFTHAGAPPPVNALRNGGGDMFGFRHQRRHGFRQHFGLFAQADRTGDCRL